MVLENECNVSGLCIRYTCLDTFSSKTYSFINRKLGAALTRKHAAITSSQSVRHIYPELLFFDLTCAKCGIGMGKVRRAAHHRNLFALVFHLFSEGSPVPAILHF